MSLFIVIDTYKKKYVCKLIDLVSIEPNPDMEKNKPTIKVRVDERD